MKIAELAIVTSAHDGRVPKANRIVVIEPEPDCAAALRADFPEVEVIDAALAGTTGPASLTIWNLPGLRSLNEPTQALKTLFPGLCETKRYTVEKLDPKRLLERLDPLPKHVLLYLDTPGETTNIINAFEATGRMGDLLELTVRAGAASFFEGEEPASRLAERLEALGLRANGTDLSDPDFPVIHFKRDDALFSLRTQLAETEDALAATRKTLTENEEALLVEREVRKKAEAEREALAKDLEASRRSAEETATEARENLSLALRMQDMLQGDIEDLRARYRKAETDRARQATLLAELAPRLRQAAHELGIPVHGEATGQDIGKQDYTEFVGEAETISNPPSDHLYKSDITTEFLEGIHSGAVRQTSAHRKSGRRKPKVDRSKSKMGRTR